MTSSSGPVGGHCSRTLQCCDIVGGKSRWAICAKSPGTRVRRYIAFFSHDDNVKPFSAVPVARCQAFTSMQGSKAFLSCATGLGVPGPLA